MESDADDIIAFFRQHGDQRFCSTCLAFEFKLTFQGVDGELATVGQKAALTEFLGQCAICGRRALVTGLERRSARSPEERVLHFVLDRVGRFFCRLHRASPSTQYRYDAEGRVALASVVRSPHRRHGVLRMRPAPARARWGRWA
jgi:hypothetical protein